MKRFYRQRKQANNNNKSSKSRKKSKDSPVPHQGNWCCLYHGFYHIDNLFMFHLWLKVETQTGTTKFNLISTCFLIDNHDPKEEMLQKFDMNMAYGPCLGMTRVERLDRAQKMGLNPPQEIERLLKSDTDIKTQSQCLWNKRICGRCRIIEYL